MNKKTKKCLECKGQVKGRIDKKFCSDQCRTTHFNRLNSDSTNFIRNINNILRKNRRILAMLNPKGTTKVSKTELLDEGFKFSYFTNTFVTKKGKIYHFCYDYGYLDLGNNTYAIVIRKEYVD